MRSEHRDLAKELVNLRETYLGEHYRELNTELNSALAGTGQGTTPEEALENARMLTEIVKLFPKKQGYNYYSIAVNDVAEARMVQSTVLWQEKYQGSPEYVPAYILGSYACQRSVDLLLCEVSDYEDRGSGNAGSASTRPKVGVSIASKVPAKSFAKAQSYMQNQRTTVVTEEDLNRLTRGGEGYEISKKTFRPVTLETGGRMSTLFADSYDAVSLGAKGGIRSVTALSNEMMGKFNVFDYIADLAVTFDKAAEVNTIVQNIHPD